MANLFRPAHIALGGDETDDPNVADQRGYFKVEQGTKDGQHIERLIWAGSSIETAREKFDAAVKHRPRGRYKLRLGTQILATWPDGE